MGALSSVDPIKEDKLAVIFGGGIGDMAVFLDALDHIVQYRRAQGFTTVLITKKANLALMHAVRPDICIEEIPIELSSLVHDSKYRVEKWSAVRKGDFSCVVSPLRSKYADLISLASGAKRRITVDEEDHSSFFNVWRHLNRLAYSERVESGISAFTQYRDLVVYLGVPFYKTRISPFIPVEGNTNLPKRPYCVVAPTASEPAKCWEQENVDRAIELILKRSNLDICLCGGSDGLEAAAHIVDRFGSSGRVLDYMGKTDFLGWVELIRNAQFCFGNDSASVHLAAHQKVPSLCVSSLFCYGYCQPYDIEHIANDDCIPVSINAEMPCARCHYKDFKRCAGNRSCKRQVNAGGVYQCIEKVSAERVLSELESLICDLGLLLGEQ